MYVIIVCNQTKNLNYYLFAKFTGQKTIYKMFKLCNNDDNNNINNNHNS